MNSATVPQLPQLPDGRFDVFVGFDLGHGETSLVSVQAEDDLQPTPSEVDNARAFPTALARVGDQYLVGRQAVTSANVEEVEIAFKTRPVLGQSGKTSAQQSSTMPEYAIRKSRNLCQTNRLGSVS